MCPRNTLKGKVPCLCAIARKTGRVGLPVALIEGHGRTQGTQDTPWRWIARIVDSRDTVDISVFGVQVGKNRSLGNVG